MKKLIVLLLSVFIIMNVFAATGTTGGAVGDLSEATLKLILNNQYKFAFIEAADGGTAPSIGTGQVTPLSEFNLITGGNALEISGQGTTLRLHPTQNVFYFYYQAYTNVDNLRIKISAPDDLKNEGSSDTIRFKASFKTVTDKWDGEAFPDSITSGSDTASSASANIKSSSTLKDFNYMGLCKVTITSDADLGTKKPGNYSANIKLTLTTN